MPSNGMTLMINVDKLSDLSEKDRRMIRAIAKQDIPEWKRPTGWLLIICGALILLLTIPESVERWPMISVVSFGGLMSIIAGMVKLYEYRVFKIIKTLLTEKNT